MEIAKKIIEQTLYCKYDFTCLKSSKNICCKVIGCVNGEVHFIKDGNPMKYCIYKMVYGDSFVCNCPTRKELYNKFGV